ncbi:MAG: hypothetical protein D9C04_02825 [Nitrosopumilus sp. B06]|nr:MAG: hypothetical protein EB828_05655 [Nitrosopumilus sp. D6]RNJ80066.1 MAG: hypothetical protein D9C04_02825 [Nitrosopumilus sp. B06]
MRGPFAFDLPPKSKRLTDREYVDLVNRIRGNFISYVAVLDSSLTMIITDFFLRDKQEIALWAGTVMDDERASFGTKSIWFSKIIGNHPAFKSRIDKETRKKISSRLSKIRTLRNEFAHNYAYNKQVSPRDVADRVITLYDFEQGITKPKKFKMSEIMALIDDPWLPKHIERVTALCRKIRENGTY